MSNDPAADGPDTEPPYHPIDCYAWEVKALASAHLRAMADFIEKPNAIITASYTHDKFERISFLLETYEHLTEPPRRYQANGAHDEVAF